MIFLRGGIPWGLAARYQIRVSDESAIRVRYKALSPVLDESGRRRFGAAEAIAAGRGGVSAVMRATGLARSTIGRGLAELRPGRNARGRLRAPAGRWAQATQGDGYEPARRFARAGRAG